MPCGIIIQTVPIVSIKKDWIEHITHESGATGLPYQNVTRRLQARPCTHRTESVHSFCVHSGVLNLFFFYILLQIDRSTHTQIIFGLFELFIFTKPQKCTAPLLN